MRYAQLEARLASVMRNLSYDALPALKEANANYAAVRSSLGLSYRPGIFLSSEGDVDKLAKGEGLPSYMLALLPADGAGSEVCPHRTPSCTAHCVSTAGNGSYNVVKLGREARTRLLIDYPASFLALLVHHIDKAHKVGPIGVRLNGFSDIRWERVLPDWFWTRFANVQFYDYTKHPLVSRPNLPANYHLTYSVSERTRDAEVKRQREAGRSVAVVIATRGGKDRRTGAYRDLPISGTKIVDGDVNDRRYLDPRGALVLLRRKGSMPADAPMVRDPATLL